LAVAFLRAFSRLVDIDRSFGEQVNADPGVGLERLLGRSIAHPALG
jgi:hypothetical protein